MTTYTELYDAADFVRNTEADLASDIAARDELIRQALRDGMKQREAAAATDLSLGRIGQIAIALQSTTSEGNQ